MTMNIVCSIVTLVLSAILIFRKSTIARIIGAVLFGLAVFGFFMAFGASTLVSAIGFLVAVVGVSFGRTGWSGAGIAIVSVVLLVVVALILSAFPSLNFVSDYIKWLWGNFLTVADWLLSYVR